MNRSKRPGPTTGTTLEVLPWLDGGEELRRRRLLATGITVAAIAHAALLLTPLIQKGVTAPPVRAVVLQPFVTTDVPIRRRIEPPPTERPAERRPATVRIPVPENVELETIDRPLELASTIELIATPDLDLVAIPDGPPPEDPDAVVDWTTGIDKPLRLTGADPLYTECARRIRLQGMVILEATIDREGAVTEVRPLKELGCGLTETATAAVSSWTFRPAARNGQPLAVRYRVSVHFELR